MTQRRAEELGGNRYGVIYRPSGGKQKGWAMHLPVGLHLVQDAAENRRVEIEDLIHAGGTFDEVRDTSIRTRRAVEARKIDNLGPLELAREAARRKSLEENVRRATVYDASSWLLLSIEHWEKGQRVGTIVERIRERLKRTNF